MRTSNKIAFTGLMLALTIAMLFLAVLMPLNRLFFTAISSVFVAVVIMEIGIGYGWLFYIASSLLALLLIPMKSIALLYAAIFGIYGIIKGYIEKIHDRWIEVILKLLFFNLSLFILYKIAAAFSPNELNISGQWSVVLLWLAAQAAFLVYDYAYTLFLRLYHNRIRKAMFR